MTLMITLEDEIADVLAKDGEVVIHAPNLSDAGFYKFCRNNPLLPMERTKEMDILVMMPADGFGDNRNVEFLLDLGNGNRALPTPGLTFGPSAGFTLPNGAIRSPDAAWIPADRWNALPVPLRAPFPHIAPDFAVEIMSPSDRLPKAQDKLEEYIANGVRLGWLVDRANRMVYVYRPNVPVDTLSDPATVAGDPELPGLTVNMARVFQETL